MNIEELQTLLSAAESNHETATDPQDVAYWQGRKDAYRTLLAELLNDDTPLRQIASSVFHEQQAQRNFVIPEFTPVKTLPNDSQCLECGATYFHVPGCRHGLGLSPEQLRERLEAVEQLRAVDASPVSVLEK